MPDSTRLQLTISTVESGSGAAKVAWRVGSDFGPAQTLTADEIADLVDLGRAYQSPSEVKRSSVNYGKLPSEIGDEISFRTIGAQFEQKWVADRLRSGIIATLEISASAVPALWTVPWELLRPDGQDIQSFHGLSVVRVVDPAPTGEARPGLDDSTTVRILLISGPSKIPDGPDAGDDPTEAQLQEILEGDAAFEILEVVHNEDFFELTQRLADPLGIDLVIFRGHGGPNGLLLNTSSEGEVEWTSGRAIARALAANHVKAAVLLACNTAAGEFGSLASHLVRSGIETAAFQVELPSHNAKAFCEGFAVALRDGATFTAAAAQGREAAVRVGGWTEAVGAMTLWQRTSHPLLLKPPPAGAVRETAPLRTQVLIRTAAGVACAPIWAGRLDLAASAVHDVAVLVSPDGRLIARRADEGRLEYAWVNRSMGDVHPGSRTTVALPDSGAGVVLAISRSGANGVLLLWTDGQGTSVWRVGAENEVRKVGDCPQNATLGTLVGGRALFCVARRGQTECRAFPGLDVESLQSVTSGGHVIVAATGRDAAGVRGTWAKIAGAEAELVAVVGAVSLVIPSSHREPPELWVDGEKRTTAIDSGQHRRTFDGWTTVRTG